MTLLAAGTAEFALLLFFSVTFPLIGLAFTIAARQRNIVNPWCANAPLLLFIGLMIGSVAVSLRIQGGGNAQILLYVIFGAAGLHVLSALMALLGLAQVRRRRKWTHGRRRAIWTIWANICILLFMAACFYTHVNQEVYNRISG